MGKFLKTAAAVGGGALILKGLDNRLETTRRTVASAKIPPEFNGFTIAHISDVHSDEVPGLTEAVRAAKPDIIVSTGDIVHHTGSSEYARGLCSELLDTAPVYLVTGNHDEWRSDCRAIYRAFAGMGAEVLNNRTVSVGRSGARIWISGIDDPFSVISDTIRARLNEYMSSLEAGDGYNILLFHRANWIDFFKDAGFDLIISGHMHGGQMRLPVLGGLVSPCSSWASGKPALFPKYVGGRYTLGGTDIIVSRGLGNPMLIPRVFNRPELVIITLEHKNSAKAQGGK